MLSSIVTETSTYSFAYDDFGNTSSVSVGNRTLASYEYNDNNGKINTLTYGNGHKVHYVYDALDRISEIQYNIGSNGAFETVYTYTYDSAGNVYSIRDHRSSEVTMYRYDAQGKLVQSYVYDDYTYLNLYGTSVYYDEQSRVSMVFHNFDYNSSTGVTYDKMYYSYSYSKSSGNIQQLTIGGNYIRGSVKPVYDNLGRTTSRTVDIDVNRVDAFYNKLTYDYVTASNGGESALVSQFISEVRTSTSSEVKSSTTYNYTYDANGNITKITDGEGEVQYQYAYDHLGQLIREDNRAFGYSYVYEYDDGGNIIAKKHYSFTTGALGSLIFTRSYGYNDSAWGDLLTSYWEDNITYDAIGNPLSVGSKEFTWEGRQLKTYFDGNYGTTTYYYNADGIMTAQETYDTECNEIKRTEYTLSGTQIVKETYYYSG